MTREPLDEVAPRTAATLRAVYRVSRAASTDEQRDAAGRITNRWTALALDAGWTTAQIADVVGQHQSVVARRAGRHRDREGRMPPPMLGVIGIEPSPRFTRAQEQARRRLLISAKDVARLVGCVPGAVQRWAQSRGIDSEWSPGGGRRLYDRDAVLAAAEAKPTVRHRKHRPRVTPPTLPATRTLSGTKSTWSSESEHPVAKVESL